MKSSNRFILLFSAIVLCTCNVFGQDEENETTTVAPTNKGFHIGFFVGSFFANKYSANVFNGYGFDNDGNRNTFENSFMYRKIVMENGGGNGNADIIAPELNVDHEDWFFGEDDMPLGMKYRPAFMFGVNLQYGINKTDAVIFNINASKITAEGVFTIDTRPPGNVNQLYPTIQYFPITGSEQRVMFQLGYSKVFGSNQYINFMVEGGLVMNSVKVEKNAIQINNLTLDLTSFLQQPGYADYNSVNYTGIGFGGFGGLGFNISASSRYIFQLLYCPSYEKINYGLYPEGKFQQGAGLRFYYTL